MGRDALLDVSVEVDPDAERDLDREQREATFYIAADALTNIARHARAHSVHIRFGLADGTRAVLEVKDDGVGFEPGQGGSGFGLRNMRERAFVAGGRLHVSSAPGRGTLVRLELPLEREVAH
jgi:signal transduction histidine kinase